MHNVYEKDTILLVDKITGEEEIPTNVKAIVVMNANDYPDVLAHVSVRARNLNVLLGVAFDQEKCNELAGLEGQNLKLEVQSQNVSFRIQNPSEVKETSGT